MTRTTTNSSLGRAVLIGAVAGVIASVVMAMTMRVDSAWAASSAAAIRTASSTVSPTGRWSEGRDESRVTGGARARVVVMAGLYRRASHSPGPGQQGGAGAYVGKP
jgi:hypothetical protein